MSDAKNKWPGRIFLCGFMGSGKSTIGMQLAEYADTPFIDLDTHIVEEAGKTITEIFEQEGEERFRSLERRMVRRACEQMHGVIALGGGALHDQEVVDLIKQRGLLIYLSASLTNLIQRIYDDRERPLLLDEHGRLKSIKELEEELGERYRYRQQWYQQAHLTVKTDQFETSNQAAEQLIQKIEEHVSDR